MVDILTAPDPRTSVGARPFTIAAAVLFHDFRARDAAQSKNQFNHFMKAVGMVGDLLVVAARPGRDDGVAPV